MIKTFSTLLETVDQPLIDLFVQETAIQRELREATVARVEHHHMMTTPAQVQFLAFLLKLIGAKRAIEVGVFTGYGTLAMAAALPADGQLIACDHSESWPLIGRPFWEAANVANKIDLCVAPAIETLQALLDEGQAGQFDFIFIDADKQHYADYFEFALSLLRPDGLVVLDNVFWINQERVADQAVPATRAVARFLESIHEDKRCDLTLLPMAQGMLLARKRGYNH